MLKYLNTEIVFAEIPDEISLAINITNCPFRCEDCHSPWLQQDKGKELNKVVLNDLIESNPGISCVLFMGGDSDKTELLNLASSVRNHNLKTAWYSGESKLNAYYFTWFDYIKVGKFIKDKGGLQSKNTNQRLYKCSGVSSKIEDITYKFWQSQAL